MASETIRIDTTGPFPCPHCGTELDASELAPFERVACPSCDGSVEVPGQVDHFIIHGPLGQGGMGVVFRGTDLKLKREVAIKSVRADKLDEGIDFEKLLQEAKSAASLKHPNIALIYSFEDNAHGVYIVMEFIDGPNLKDLLAERSILEPALVARIGTQLADALENAADIGLTHSDIKPGNVLLAAGDQAKLVDFGLARFRQEVDPTERLWGSPYYIAPERLNRKGETPLSDQYSLGAMMRHCLTGEPPFKGETRKETLANVRAGATESCGPLRSENPAVPQKLAAAVERMMALDPADRYPTYASLLTDLRRVSESIKAETRASANAARNTPAIRQGLPPAVWWIVGALGLLIVAGGLAAVVFAPDKPQPAAPTTAQTPPPKPKPASKPQPKPKPKPTPLYLGENLVQNASFEERQKGAPKKWELRGKKDDRKISVVTDPKAAGRHCLEILALKPQQFGRAIQRIDLEPQTSYQLSVRIKTNGVKGQNPNAGGAAVIIWDYDNKLQAIAETTSVTGTTDWQTIKMNFRTHDLEQYKIVLTVGVNGKATGLARFDEIKIQRIQ